MAHVTSRSPTKPSRGQPEPPSSHPYRIAFSGHATPATADLVSRLADVLSGDFSVGRTRSAAANLFERHYGLLDYDIVLCERTAAAPDQPTVLLLDQSGSSDGAPVPAGHVIATVGPGVRVGVVPGVGPSVGPTVEPAVAPAAGPAAGSTIETRFGTTLRPGSGIGGSQVPHHHPEEVADIAATIRSHLLAHAQRSPLYGLVLTGGRSRRMGRPKWALEYRGTPHALHLHALMESHCQQAFLSISQDQLHEPALTARPHLVDRFPDTGPLGGILTAMTSYPDAAWLVLACDLPFVRSATIARLLAERAPFRFATCYRSPHDERPEPLCTIYEAKSRLRLFQLLALGNLRPRRMLQNARIRLIATTDEDELVNANDEIDVERALARLGESDVG